MIEKVDVVFNGRGLDLPMNGIPRYMREILIHIDKCLANEMMNVEVVVPETANIKVEFQNIKFIQLKNGILWDYLIAERYAKKKKALYVNLASKGTLYKKSICTIHDIRVLKEKTNINYKNLKNKAKLIISYALAVRNARDVVTVSRFSQNELIKYYSIAPNKIHVIGNGWEHLKKIQEDKSIFDEYPQINKKNYYFSLGSIAPHKNFRWIIENKKIYSQIQFVIMGKVDTNIWKDTTNELSGIIYVGYQSDERMLSLMKNAKALVFPSVYEGFGIPPLEALALSTPAIVADIPVMREIFGDSVYYFNENDYSVDLDKMLENKKVDVPDDVLCKYSWEKSAKMWLDLIKSRVNNC